MRHYKISFTVLYIRINEYVMRIYETRTVEKLGSWLDSPSATVSWIRMVNYLLRRDFWGCFELLGWG